MKKIINSAKLNTRALVSSSLLVFAFAMFFGLSLTASAATFAPFTSQMHPGDNNSQVQELQSLLATNSFIYPQGITSGYFGSLTQAAVGQFQLNYNLPAVGAVGPLTLAALNNVIAAGNGLDIFAPIISNVNVQSMNTTSSVVNWTTDTPAQGKVFYSSAPLQESDAQAAFTAPYISGSSVQSNGNYQNSQSVAVDGLTPNTMYYYVIMATDPAGNVSVTNQGTFLTM